MGKIVIEAEVDSQGRLIVPDSLKIEPGRAKLTIEPVTEQGRIPSGLTREEMQARLLVASRRVTDHGTPNDLEPLSDEERIMLAKLVALKGFTSLDLVNQDRGSLSENEVE